LVEFELKLHPKQRLVYLPKELANLLGRNIRASANCVAVLMYPENIELKDILKSIEIIQLDLKHKISLEGRTSQSLEK